MIIQSEIKGVKNGPYRPWQGRTSERERGDQQGWVQWSSEEDAWVLAASRPQACTAVGAEPIVDL